MLRTMLIAAAVIAPLASTPASAAAQEQGTVQAALVGAAAQAAGQNGRAQGRPTELPPQIAELFTGQALPPGLANTRAPAADQGDGSGGTQGDDGEDECAPVPVIVDGKLMILNCDGTLSDPFGGSE